MALALVVGRPDRDKAAREAASAVAGLNDDRIDPAGALVRTLSAKPGAATGTPRLPMGS